MQLAEELFKNEIAYVSKVAKTEGETCVLMEAGFDFVCDFDGHKLFRKKKYQDRKSPFVNPRYILP